MKITLSALALTLALVASAADERLVAHCDYILQFEGHTAILKTFRVTETADAYKVYYNDRTFGRMVEFATGLGLKYKQRWEEYMDVAAVYQKKDCTFSPTSPLLLDCSTGNSNVVFTGINGAVNRYDDGAFHIKTSHVDIESVRGKWSEFHIDFYGANNGRENRMTISYQPDRCHVD